MDKSPDAFRTISEVADWLGTPAHVLRFWESRFTQIKPVKRAGGRRYYRPADMALLGGIKRLLHDDGLTIRGVQKILREQGVKHVAAMSPPVEELDAVPNPVPSAPIAAEPVAEPPVAPEQNLDAVELSPQPADERTPVRSIPNEPAITPEPVAPQPEPEPTESVPPVAAYATDDEVDATAPMAMDDAPPHEPLDSGSVSTSEAQEASPPPEPAPLVPEEPALPFALDQDTPTPNEASSEQASLTTEQVSLTTDDMDERALAPPAFDTPAAEADPTEAPAPEPTASTSLAHVPAHEPQPEPAWEPAPEEQASEPPREPSPEPKLEVPAPEPQLEPVSDAQPEPVESAQDAALRVAALRDSILELLRDGARPEAAVAAPLVARLADLRARMDAPRS